MTYNLKDMTGQVFGELTVISRAPNNSQRRARWLCKCSCGNTTVVYGKHLRNGNTKSCGCLSRPHGMKGTRFYRIWTGMKTRCTNPNHEWYKHYGGRGITFEERWSDFINFRDDMYTSYLEHVTIHGENNTTLERKDGNLGYSSDNCTWATRKEQSRNARRHVTLVYNGVEKPLFVWADELGITYQNLYHRIFIRHMPVEKAMSSLVGYDLSRKRTIITN